MFRTLLSGELISEIAITLIALGYDDVTAGDTALLLTAIGEVRALKHYVMGCSDAGDDHLYELALIGPADCIVSRDKRVLEPPPHVASYLVHHGIALMEPADFANLIAPASQR